MRSTISRCSMAMAGLLAASCAGTRPVHYYTLAPASVPVNQSMADGPTILVGTIATPESLQDARIRYRAGANEAGAYEYHRWTERPAAIVHESMVRALRASGKYQRVLESSSSAAGDYVVHGTLYEFGEVDNSAIQTRISIQVDVVNKGTNRTVWDHLYDHEEPVKGKNIKDVVQSMDRNLQQVVSEVAADVDRFLADRR